MRFIVDRINTCFVIVLVGIIHVMYKNCFTPIFNQSVVYEHIVLIAGGTIQAYIWDYGMTLLANSVYMCWLKNMACNNGITLLENSVYICWLKNMACNMHENIKLNLLDNI